MYIQGYSTLYIQGTIQKCKIDYTRFYSNLVSYVKYLSMLFSFIKKVICYYFGFVCSGMPNYGAPFPIGPVPSHPQNLPPTAGYQNPPPTNGQPFKNEL